MGLSCGYRPEFELYDVSKDRDCLENLAANPESETLIANHFSAKAFQRFCMSTSSSGSVPVLM